MRSLRFLNLTVLSLVLGTSAFLYAQDDKPPEKPKQEDARPEAKPQDQAKPQDDMKPAHQDEAKPTKQEKQNDNEMKKQDEQTRDHASPEHSDQMHPAQAGNAAQGKGGHIPDDKFRSHFGQSHKFRASTVIVSGQPQFTYGGYSFQLVDAWPADWAYTDDCYIDYIDGEYFLIDLLHPGIRIAVIVVM